MSKPLPRQRPAASAVLRPPLLPLLLALLLMLLLLLVQDRPQLCVSPANVALPVFMGPKAQLDLADLCHMDEASCKAEAAIAVATAQRKAKSVSRGPSAHGCGCRYCQLDLAVCLTAQPAAQQSKAKATRLKQGCCPNHPVASSKLCTAAWRCKNTHLVQAAAQGQQKRQHTMQCVRSDQQLMIVDRQQGCVPTAC